MDKIMLLFFLTLILLSGSLCAGQFDIYESKKLFNYISGMIRHNGILSPELISDLQHRKANINILHTIDTNQRKMRPIHIVTNYLSRFNPDQITPKKLSDLETLVSRGVNLALKDAHGNTPFASTLINSSLLKDATIIDETRNAGVMKKLIDLDCAIDEVYEKRISYPYTSLVNQDMHDIVIDQMTPLMICAYIDDYANYKNHSATPYDLRAIPQLLLDHGVDVNATDSYGNTALHHVAASITIPVKQRTHLIKMLLKQKADINYQNNDGKTPIYYASIACNRPYNVNGNEVVTYLLHNNAEHESIAFLSPHVVTQLH